MEEADLTLIALHLAWRQYRAHPDSTLTPASFLRWLGRHRRELLGEVGEAGVRRFLSETALA